MQSLQQFVPSELRSKKLEINSVINNRTTRRFNPINGTNGYSGRNQKTIEFNISHNELFDLSTMVVSFNYTKPTNGRCEDMISSLFGTVEVYLADRLIERIEHYGLWKNAIIYASANDSFYQRELNAMSGAGFTEPLPSGDYVVSLDLLGITKVGQYLPLLSNNLRIKITLARPEDSHSRTGAGGDEVADYQMNNVNILCDTVDVMDGYRANLMRAIASDEGITIPIQTFDIKERDASELMNFNLSYSEADSFYGLVLNNDSEHKTSEAPLDGFVNLVANFSGKYLTPVDGIKGYAELYMAMRKSFASLHDADGSTILDKEKYQNFTLIGLDGEKVPAHNEVVGNGINTRALSYTLDIKLQYGHRAGDKFILAVLHRKMLKLANNAVEVAE